MTDFYCYAIGKTYAALADLVNEMMRTGEGWTPVGNIFQRNDPVEGFCQAMYRQPPRSETSIYVSGQ